MSAFNFISDLGGALFSIFSVFFVAGMGIRHFLLKNRPTYLHIAMHFLRRYQGKLVVKMPTINVLMLPDMYDYITATWLLLCARRWAKRSPHGPILSIPCNENTTDWHRFVPHRQHFIRPIMRWLSAANFEDWRDRAARAARDPDADPQEEPVVIALIFEDRSRSLRGLVVPVKVLEMFLEKPDEISNDPHPHYGGAQDRPEVLRVVAKAWSEWREGMHPELAMGLLEL